MNERALERSLVFVKDWLKFNFDRDTVPGFVVAVSYKGKILLNQAYGFANIEKKQKMTPGHMFRIASHSKTFTATAIMQLQEKGKLKIDEPAAKYLTWLKDHKDPRFKKVTIRQLMSHSAGIIRDGVDSDYWEMGRDFPSRDEFIKDILGTGLVLDTNKRMKYSNYGYTLLGLVIEAVSGQEYNKYVAKNIVGALNLKNTVPEYSKSLDKRLATGYGRIRPDKSRPPLKHINTHIMSPATGFCSTTEDLCKYFTAQIQGSGKLLGDESKKEMQRTQWKVAGRQERDEYALGLAIEHGGEHRLFGHGGGFPGYITKSLADSENKLVVVVLTNYTRGGAGTKALNVIKIIDFFQEKAAKIPKQELARLEGRYMSTFSVINIVAADNGLISVDPFADEPFYDPVELKKDGVNTFKITECGSYDSEGELVQFKPASPGKVDSVIFAGETLLPEKVYMGQNS